jgi:hypothetical protein
MTSRSADERLRLLRAGDDWRQWHSVDDERLCIECARLITGREIVVIAEEDDRTSLHCPTPGCKSTPRDWFYHGTREARTLDNIVQAA